MGGAEGLESEDKAGDIPGGMAEGLGGWSCVSVTWEGWGWAVGAMRLGDLRVACLPVCLSVGLYVYRTSLSSSL